MQQCTVPSRVRQFVRFSTVGYKNQAVLHQISTLLLDLVVCYHVIIRHINMCPKVCILYPLHVSDGTSAVDGLQTDKPTEVQLEGSAEAQWQGPSEGQHEGFTKGQLDGFTKGQLEGPTEVQLGGSTEAQHEGSADWARLPEGDRAASSDQALATLNRWLSRKQQLSQVRPGLPPGVLMAHIAPCNGRH